MLRLHFFHETIAAQWYCPPAVGYAERNSAREAARHILQIPATMRPHMTELGPPDGKARVMEAARAVQVLRMAKARPSMDIIEKLRLSSCLWPSCASIAASCAMMLLRRALLSCGCLWSSIVVDVTYDPIYFLVLCIR